MWDRFLPNPLEETAEHARWRRAVKTAEKNLRELAAGSENFQKTVRSIDRVQDFDRFIEPEEREVGARLRRQIRDAEEAGLRVRQGERESELRRLKEAQREEWFGLTTFEKELRLGKARRS